MIADSTPRIDLRYVWASYIAWLGLTWGVPKINRVVDLWSVNPWIIPTVRMLLMLGVAYAVVRWVEHTSFASGFHLSKRRLLPCLLWAVGFAGIAFGAEWLYGYVVMSPLLGGTHEASSAHESVTLRPAFERAVEYSYILIGLTFVLGLIISLSYVRTRNVLAPILCHLLVDSPSAVSILLGRGA